MTDPEDPSRSFDVDTGETTPVGPGWSSSTFNPHVVDFGHYSGRTIEELAETDPSYLYWLARHPAGARVAPAAAVPPAPGIFWMTMRGSPGMWRGRCRATRRAV